MLFNIKGNRKNGSLAIRFFCRANVGSADIFGHRFMLVNS